MKCFICWFEWLCQPKEWFVTNIISLLRVNFLLFRKNVSEFNIWLMIHRLPIASNFGRELSSNPVRHVVSHAPASQGMCLCIKQGWSGVWDEMEGLWFSWRSRRSPRARSRAWRIHHSINVQKIRKDYPRGNSFDRYRSFEQIVYSKNEILLWKYLITSIHI